MNRGKELPKIYRISKWNMDVRLATHDGWFDNRTPPLEVENLIDVRYLHKETPLTYLTSDDGRIPHAHRQKKADYHWFNKESEALSFLIKQADIMGDKLERTASDIQQLRCNLLKRLVTK